VWFVKFVVDLISGSLATPRLGRTDRINPVCIYLVVLGVLRHAVGHLCVNALAGADFGGRDTAYIILKAEQKAPRAPPCGGNRHKG
jgi:hypothetical protein